MAEICSGVCVHLLDPMPGGVIARIIDGLREEGHRVEFRGDSTFSRAERIPTEAILTELDPADGQTNIYLTSRPLDTGKECPPRAVVDREHRSAIVGVPEAAGRDRFAPGLATRVLDLVLRELRRLEPKTAPTA